MAIYLGFVAIILGLLAGYDITKRKYFYNIAIIIMCLFAGLRYRVGTDYITYEFMFKQSRFQTLTDYKGDTGFLIVSKIINYFTDNVRVHFFVISVFITFLFMICIYKYSKFKFLSVLIYLTLGGYFIAFNIMRQYIAIAIIAYSIRYIGTNKNLKYYILVLIAGMFHSTALIMLPIKILLELEWNKKIYFLLFTVSSLIFLNVNMFMRIFNNNDRISIYSDSYFIQEGSNIITFLVYLSMVIFGYIYIKNDKKLKQDKFFKLMVIFVIFSFISIRSLIFARIAAYFNIGIIIFIPNIWGNIRERDKNILLFLVIIFLIIYLIAILNKQGGLIPYRIY